jgi:hypothetical protein
MKKLVVFGGISMKLERHDLDIYPVPKEKTPLFINEPWLIDDSNYESSWGKKEPENADDNIRVYIPLDINKNAILRRLDHIIARYGEVNEGNESNFSFDVAKLISQVEIYDQIWYVRLMSAVKGEHSAETIELVNAFIAKLEEIPDGGAEIFPFELIDGLKGEFLGD